MKKEYSLSEFEDLKQSYFETEEAITQYNAIHDRFETQVQNAIRLRDRARSGLTNEKISITLYGWMQKYLERTKRYETIEDIMLEGQKGKFLADYIERTLVFVAETEENV